MCGHIVGPFLGVLVDTVSVGRESRQKPFQIDTYGRIGVLTDDQRCTGVLYEHMAEAGLDARLANDLVDLGGQFVGAPPRGGLLQRVLKGHGHIMG